MLDKAKLDALLQAKWEGMKAALVRGDIEGAVGYFAEPSIAAFRAEFTRVAQHLPELVAGMGMCRLVEAAEEYAEYDLRTVKDGVAYSFHVLFMREANGLWKIMSF